MIHENETDPISSATGTLSMCFDPTGYMGLEPGSTVIDMTNNTSTNDNAHSTINDNAHSTINDNAHSTINDITNLCQSVQNLFLALSHLCNAISGHHPHND